MRAHDWVKEFKMWVKKLKAKTGDKTYSDSQRSLSVLKRTGKGNCVAWTELAAEISFKFKLGVYFIVVRDISDQKDKKIAHQVSIVFDAEENYWLQDNCSVRKIVGSRGNSNHNRNLLSAILKTLSTRAIKNLWDNGATILSISEMKETRKKKHKST